MHHIILVSLKDYLCVTDRSTVYIIANINNEFINYLCNTNILYKEALQYYKGPVDKQ